MVVLLAWLINVYSPDISTPYILAIANHLYNKTHANIYMDELGLVSSFVFSDV